MHAGKKMKETVLAEKKSRGELKTAMIVDNHWMKWGPAESLIIFDVIFFLNYALGWILTYTYNEDFIHDNGVVRTFGVYNICIGVDSEPARPICAVVFIIAFAFFVWSCYLHWLKIYFDGGMNLKFATIWVNFSCLLTLTFGLTYSVPPVTFFKFLVHVGSFATGLTGYVMLKGFSIAEFFIFVKYDCRDFKSMCYIWSMILMTSFMTLFVFILIWILLDPDLEKKFNGPVLKREKDHLGNLLVFFTAIGPPLQWFFAPKELKHTCHLVDATQCKQHQPTLVGQPEAVGA